MPTPRPIITPSVGAMSGTVKTLVRMVMVNAPMPTPTSAVPTVTPMATTEPTAAISTNTAKARPMASVSGGSCSASQKPPTSTCTPASRRPLRSMRCSISMPASTALSGPTLLLNSMSA